MPSFKTPGKNGGEGSSAVGQEELLHVVAVGLEHHGRAAQIADLLGGALDHAVALARLGVDDLAGPGDFEPLFSGRFGLQLGHLALLGLTPFWKFSGSCKPVRVGMSEENRHGSPNGRAVLMGAAFRGKGEEWQARAWARRLF